MSRPSGARFAVLMLIALLAGACSAGDDSGAAADGGGGASDDGAGISPNKPAFGNPGGGKPVGGTPDAIGSDSATPDAAGADAGPTGGGPDVPGGVPDSWTPVGDPDAGPGWDAPPIDEDAAPWVDPDSVCGYGTVYGLICSVSEQTFVDGATVWVDTVDCDGNPLHVETTSDGDGYYTLEGVPNGLQTIQIKRDDFEKTHTVSVKNDKVTDVTGVGHKECFQFVDPDVCTPGKQNINVEAKLVTGIADIVWFIDTSGSMDEEAKYLQNNINAFANYIGNQAVDFRVVLIAEGFGICVPEPLGGPGCTDGPSFRHVHEAIDSHNGPEKVMETYPLYQDFLRPDATTNFIAVTDDNSKKSASWFTNEAAGKTNPGFSKPFLFHSIVGMGTLPFVGCIGAAQTGSVYLQLSAQTGGATFPICNTDWSSTFGAMAESVVNGLQTTCGYAVPNPAALNNATKISLKHNGGGAYTQVAGPDQCTTTPSWYLVGQDELFLCPSSCSIITGGVLELNVSCN